VSSEPGIRLEETLDGVLGLKYEMVSAERVEGTLPLVQAYEYPPGHLRTGIAAAVAEALASAGTAAGVMADGGIPMGQWNETTVVGTPSGSVLTAVGSVVARSADQWLWDLRFETEPGHLVATSRVCIAVRPRDRSSIA
jgi:1,4-dihydroxy-2-naphthoyl-CoA hydrolase